MGTITSCEPNFEIKSPRKEINSAKNFLLNNKMPKNKKINLREKKVNSKTQDKCLRNKINKKIFNNNNNDNNNARIKDSSKLKFIESNNTAKKGSPNKYKTNSYNSFTTNYNSRNINNNKRMNTDDNTKNITISEEETITNQNTVDYLNNLNLKNKNNNYNNLITLKKQYFSRNKITNSKNQMINIIDEENEDIINSSKMIEVKDKLFKNKRKNNLYLLSSDSESLKSLYQNTFNKINYNKSKKNNKLRNVYSSNFLNQLDNKQIYKKATCFNMKSKINTNTGKNMEKIPIFKIIKKNKKVSKLDLDDNNFNNNEEGDGYLNQNNHYFFSEINKMNKCPSYKNENKIIKKLEMTKKCQEKEIILLKKKVNSLCNIIEDNNNFKENIIKKKDKLIYNLQKEKIKNENIIKKLKTQLKYKDKNEININKEIIKNYTKIQKKNKKDTFKTENISYNNENVEIFKNLIYEKKKRKDSNSIKKKILRNSIPIKINIDLTIPNKPLTKYKNGTYEMKNKFEDFSKEKNNQNLVTNYNLNSVKLADEKRYSKEISRNKSDFNEQFNTLKVNNFLESKKYILDNLIYVPKNSKLSKQFVFHGYSREGRLGKSKSITNINPLISKFNNKNKEIRNENIEYTIDNSNKETISLNGTNNLNDSLIKKEDASMNLNLSPIIKNYSKNILQSIEDTSIDDFLKTKTSNQNVFNIINNQNNNENLNYIYENKLKLDYVDIGQRAHVSPKMRQNNDQNINQQKKYFYAKEYFNKWNITFIILNEKVEIILNKNELLSNAVETIISKIKENKTLYKKFDFIIDNKDNLIFLSNSIILNKEKSLEENNLSNHSKIFVILEL